jgi:hypothetical protein
MAREHCKWMKMWHDSQPDPENRSQPEFWEGFIGYRDCHQKHEFITTETGIDFWGEVPDKPEGIWLVAKGIYSSEYPVVAFSSLAKAKGQFPVDTEWKPAGEKGNDVYALLEVGTIGGRPYFECFSIYKVTLDPEDWDYEKGARRWMG